MTSSITMMQGITNCIISVILLAVFSCPLQVIAADSPGVRYSETIKSSGRDLYGVNPIKLEKEAQEYFYTGINSEDDKTKEAYLSKALAKYMLLLKFKPKDVITCTQIGIIYDNLGKSKEAKQFFTRAVNINSVNPYANFNFGAYYYSDKKYQEALEHFLIAYRSGYKNSYDVNLKLAEVYEKLGDINKAKQFYKSAQKLKPAEKWISEKVKSLNKAYYSKSDFQQ